MNLYSEFPYRVHWRVDLDGLDEAADKDFCGRRAAVGCPRVAQLVARVVYELALR
jgi:hypothetical protein